MSYLTITIRLVNGHRPTSATRGMNVGVGGSHHVARGEPVRRATLAELRMIDRENIESMVKMFPNGKIEFSRWQSIK